ncbi:hypothetical protein [Rhodoferax sp. UBA5149]|uniref:hypothetical protein n=1 Tax=Rhodoferax sp. UBA5149 TaxID=1947379 RepID=UPI0025E023F1|nr:hypothetical protein [Rhodoferax sp. UBA5149]
MDSEKPAASPNSPPGPLASGRFSGREAFEKLVRDALARAAHDGWQEIILSDATFEDWPLRERSVLESLHAWSAAGRHMTLLATRYDEVMRNHARFVSWRKTWGHIIDCRVCRVTDSADFPSAIWSRAWFMHRLDPQRSTGTCGYDRERSVQLRETLHEKLRHSAPGFPATTLGL